ncbi:hypothetical protein [Ferruginibacter sp. HRS2-29]|uniref:hypothetical protein n=1 Tax=Ferruginibacter sp. HRS2-29 TaxID=2487334 RepID=UPI0020CB9080|nr:hypothetical protein [Ferruginibacter sp. HRS2-29]MCP9751225.1 hypothetical protein [Ferruginibacter sp. HRS2-29]
MLQNRVTPLGDIIRTNARGAWMGNRGLIHNKQQEINRSFRLKAWIICLLKFKDRHRPVMAPGQYTELFFLDEATAFAAGHRPCAECRREDFIKFKSFWVKANAGYSFDMKTPVGKIDEIIHQERISEDGSKKTSKIAAGDIPDGTFILQDNNPYLVWNKKMYRWSPEGYGKAIPLPATKEITALTPGSIIKAFREGYLPQIAL